jgi:hypothetical protein
MKADSTPMQENRLLEEGARSYPKALHALGEFRRQVREQCEAAFKANATEMAKAMQLQFSAADVKSWANPERPGGEGAWAELGAKVGRPKNAKCNLWNYVLWSDAPPRSARISIQLLDADVAYRAWTAMGERENWQLSHETKEISISRCLAPTDLTRLKTILGELNREWSSAWRKVGGAQQFLGRR